MRRMLSYKLNTIKFLDSVSENIKQVLEESKTEETDDLTTNTIRINLNKVEEPGMMLNAKLMLFSPQLKEEIDRIRAVHNFVPTNNVLMELSTTVKDVTVDDAVKQIEKVLATLPGGMKGWFNVVADQGKLSLGINSPMTRLTGTESVDPLLDIV